MLTRDQIAQVKDFDLEPVEVPEWGGTVYIRSMTSRSLDEMQVLFLRLTGGQEQPSQRLKDPEALLDMKVRLVAFCLCDSSGSLLFDDEEGRAILASKNGKVIERLYDTAMALNGMSDEAMEQEKKDSLATLSGALNSDSASH